MIFTKTDLETIKWLIKFWLTNIVSCSIAIIIYYIYFLIKKYSK